MPSQAYEIAAAIIAGLMLLPVVVFALFACGHAVAAGFKRAPLITLIQILLAAAMLVVPSLSLGLMLIVLLAVLAPLVVYAGIISLLHGLRHEPIYTVSLLLLGALLLLDPLAAIALILLALAVIVGPQLVYATCVSWRTGLQNEPGYTLLLTVTGLFCASASGWALYQPAAFARAIHGFVFL